MTKSKTNLGEVESSELIFFRMLHKKSKYIESSKEPEGENKLRKNKIPASMMKFDDIEFFIDEGSSSVVFCISLGCQDHQGDYLEARVNQFRNFILDKNAAIERLKSVGCDVSNIQNSWEFKVMVADTLQSFGRKQKEQENIYWEKCGDIWEMGELSELNNEQKEAGKEFSVKYKDLFEKLSNEGMSTVEFWHWFEFIERLGEKSKEFSLFVDMMNFLEKKFAEGKAEYELKTVEAISVSKYTLRYIFEEVVLTHMYLFRGVAPLRKKNCLGKVSHVYPGEVGEMICAAMAFLETNQEFSKRCAELFPENPCDCRIVVTFINESQRAFVNKKKAEHTDYIECGMPDELVLDADLRREYRIEHRARQLLLKKKTALLASTAIVELHQLYLKMAELEYKDVNPSKLKCPYMPVLTAGSKALGEIVDEFAAKDEGPMTLLLTGASGCGKSFFLKSFYAESWRRYIHDPAKQRVPIYIDLKTVELGGEASLGAFLRPYIKEICGVDIDDIREFPLLFIFDGYDEKKGEDCNLYSKNDLGLFVNSKLIVGCRSDYLSYIGNYKDYFICPTVEKVQEVKIEPLKCNSQINTFLEAFVSATLLLPEEQERKLEYFKEILSNQHDKIESYLQTPMSLLMLLNILSENDVDIQNLSDINKHYFDNVLNAEANRVFLKIGNSGLKKNKIKRAFCSTLELVAYDMVKSLKTNIANSRLTNVLEHQLLGVGVELGEMQADEVVSALPLSRVGDGDEYYFDHSSYRDYFAGVRVYTLLKSKNNEEQRLASSLISSSKYDKALAPVWYAALQRILEQCKVGKQNTVLELFWKEVSTDQNALFYVGSSFGVVGQFSLLYEISRKYMPKDLEAHVVFYLFMSMMKPFRLTQALFQLVDDNVKVIPPPNCIYVFKSSMFDEILLKEMGCVASEPSEYNNILAFINAMLENFKHDWRFLIKPLVEQFQVLSGVGYDPNRLLMVMNSIYKLYPGEINSESLEAVLVYINQYERSICAILKAKFLDHIDAMKLSDDGISKYFRLLVGILCSKNYWAIKVALDVMDQYDLTELSDDVLWAYLQLVWKYPPKVSLNGEIPLGRVGIVSELVSRYMDNERVMLMLFQAGKKKLRDGCDRAMYNLFEIEALCDMRYLEEMRSLKEVQPSTYIRLKYPKEVIMATAPSRETSSWETSKLEDMLDNYYYIDCPSFPHDLLRVFLQKLDFKTRELYVLCGIFEKFLSILQRLDFSRLSDMECKIILHIMIESSKKPMIIASDSLRFTLFCMGGVLMGLFYSSYGIQLISEYADYLYFEKNLTKYQKSILVHSFPLNRVVESFSKKSSEALLWAAIAVLVYQKATIKFAARQKKLIYYLDSGGRGELKLTPELFCFAKKMLFPRLGGQLLTWLSPEEELAPNSSLQLT